MDFSQAPQGLGRHRVGLVVVVVMHLLLGWALVSGLARRVVDVVRAPIETKIIEEARLPEPPPPPPPPPPPKVVATPPPPVAPPAYVPPPEVPVVAPPAPTPTLTPSPVPPPPAEVRIEPAAPSPTPQPPRQPVRTLPALNFGNCKPDYTPAAYRAGTEGTVVVAYTMEADGHISEAHVERSSGATREHKQLDRATVEAVLACRGRAGTVDGRAERLSGRVEYVWRLDN